MQNTMSAALYAISPLDGRYRSRLNGVSTYLSEYAYIKYRVRSYPLRPSPASLSVRAAHASSVRLFGRTCGNFAHVLVRRPGHAFWYGECVRAL
jgi:hypothetical protein